MQHFENVMLASLPPPMDDDEMTTDNENVQATAAIQSTGK